MHLKYINLLFLLILELQINAQHFDWAASGSNIFSGFHTSCITHDGRLVAGVNYEPTYLGGVPSFYAGNGNEFEIESNQKQALVVSYNNLGNIEWIIDYKIFGRDSKVLGLTAKSNGEIVVAYTSGYINRDIIYVTPNENDKTKRYSGNYVFFSIIDIDGNVKSTFASTGLRQIDWMSFEYSAFDEAFIIAYANHEKTIDFQGKNRSVGHNYTIKIDKSFKELWTHKTMYLDETCCSFFIPACKAIPAKNGDIYIAGVGRIGVKLDGSKNKIAPILDEVTQYNKPYESYIAKLNSDGKLLWVEYSEGKSIINDIKTDGNKVVIGGQINLQKKMFGAKIDTTENKNAFIASFDNSGKRKWIQTFNAAKVDALSLDNEGNIFASFSSNRSRVMKPLKIGTDTLSNTYTNIVIACFDKKGEYKWSKTSKAMLSREANMHLHNDDCGNLYLSAEMWYSLPVNMNIFDAAIVKGKGYGGAPLAARVKTTIPEEVLEINHSLVEIPNENSQNACVPIPYPWKMIVFPNPTNGEFSVRVTTSYNDNDVSMELWDLKGAKIRTLMNARKISTGIFEERFNVSDLANGVYIIVLKGTGNSVTERLVINK